MKNAVNWFEIAVLDYDRAKQFYETVMGIKMHEMHMDNFDGRWGFFEFEEEGVGGSIVQAEGYEPSSKGVLLYLNAGDDLAIPLSKVEAAGGKVVLPKTSIGENGFMAFIIDTEGNKMGLHSMG